MHFLIFSIFLKILLISALVLLPQILSVFPTSRHIYSTYYDTLAAQASNWLATLLTTFAAPEALTYVLGYLEKLRSTCGNKH